MRARDGALCHWRASVCRGINSEEKTSKGKGSKVGRKLLMTCLAAG